MSKKAHELLNKINQLNSEEQLTVFLSMGENLARINQYEFVDTLAKVFLADIKAPEHQQQLTNFTLLVGHLWDIITRRLVVDRYCDIMKDTQGQAESTLNVFCWNRGAEES